MTNEPPAVAPRRRRRHPVLAISGWTLLVCLFLPTLRVCGDPMMPIQFPPTYGVYLGGMLIAVIAGTAILRWRQRAAAFLVLLWCLTAGAWAGLTTVDQNATLGWILCAVSFLASLAIFRLAWRRPRQDLGIFILCLVHAAASTFWCSVLAFDKDTMWGAYVGLAASLGLLVGTIAATGREVRDRAERRRATEPAPLPTAILIE